jgi:hypothetical protein
MVRTVSPRLPCMGRIKFWWQAIKAGTKELDAVASWFGLVVLALGLVAGIVVPLVTHVSYWLTAVIVLVILLLVVLEGSYEVWRKTDKERKTPIGTTAEAVKQGPAATRFPTGVIMPGNPEGRSSVSGRLTVSGFPVGIDAGGAGQHDWSGEIMVGREADNSTETPTSTSEPPDTP